MTKTKTALAFLLFLSQFTGYSQAILKGAVTDSLQNPLPNANIIAEPQDSINKIKFAITGNQGHYVLELENIPYTVTVSYMGYKPYSFEMQPAKTIVKDIVLEKSTESLKEVVIEIPMVVKEDTIIYNVETFMTGEERKLQDILKKLPGVEVADDGSVTVNGKTVTTLLVEDKKFFGGGTKLGVENIPADAVDQVEVIDNYTEIPFLKNLQESDKMALNIKLKEGKKNFVFGDVEAGKGNRDFYRAHANLFYYSPNTVMNAIGNLNNIAEKVFTYQQYFQFKGGLNEIFLQGSTDFSLPGDDVMQFMEIGDVVSSQRQFGALNISQKVNNKLNISGYGIFSKTKAGAFSQSVNQYNAFTEKTQFSSNNDSFLAIGNLKAKYIPNLTEEWHYKTQFKSIDNQYAHNIVSVIDTNQNTFLTNKEVAERSFNQVVEWHKKSSREHTFSAAAAYTYHENSPQTLWNTSNPVLQGFLPVMEVAVYRVKQLKKLKSNRINAIFKHYWVLDRNNHIYSTLGNTYFNQRFFTRSFQKLENGGIHDFKNENFGNDLNFNLNDLFLGLHYKFRTGIFTFDQGAFVHQYHWKVKQQNTISKNKMVILPDVSIKAEFNQTKELEFNYEIESSFSEASKFANKYYLLSYNTLFKGNENLENELSHNFNLRFSKYGGYRGISISAFANYKKQIKGVKNAIEFQGINQRLMPVLLDSPESGWGFYGKIEKDFKDIDLSVGLRHNSSKYIQQVNGDFQSNKSNNSSYKIAAQLFFENLPLVEVGFGQSFGSYVLGGQESKFSTFKPYLSIDYDFWDGFIVSFDYTGYQYRNKSLNMENSYQLAKASLYYRKGTSAWSFKLKARNLFDANYKNQNRFSSYVISNTKTYILPRIIMFTVGYNL